MEHHRRLGPEGGEQGDLAREQLVDRVVQQRLDRQALIGGIELPRRLLQISGTGRRDGAQFGGWKVLEGGGEGHDSTGKYVAGRAFRRNGASAAST